MKNNNIIVLMGLCLLMLGTACSKKTSLFKKSPTKSLTVDQLDFNYFSAKSKIDIKDPNLNVSGIATIRMKKDSIIWLSVSPGFGIEAGRAIITPDTVLAINKFGSTYYAYSYGQLSKMYDVPIDFSLLQSLFIGNLPVAISKKENKIEKKEEHIFITQQWGPMSAVNEIDPYLKKLVSLTLTNPTQTSKLSLKFSDFQPMQEQYFPHRNEISIQKATAGKEKLTQITIKHAKAEITDSPLSFPFSIPDRYAPK